MRLWGGKLGAEDGAQIGVEAVGGYTAVGEQGEGAGVFFAQEGEEEVFRAGGRLGEGVCLKLGFADDAAGAGGEALRGGGVGDTAGAELAKGGEEAVVGDAGGAEGAGGDGGGVAGEAEEEVFGADVGVTEGGGAVVSGADSGLSGGGEGHRGASFRERVMRIVFPERRGIDKKKRCECISWVKGALHPCGG